MVMLITLDKNTIPIKRGKYSLPSSLRLSKRMWVLGTMSQFLSQETIQLTAEIIIFALARDWLKWWLLPNNFFKTFLIIEKSSTFKEKSYLALKIQKMNQLMRIKVLLLSKTQSTLMDTNSLPTGWQKMILLLKFMIS